MEPTDFQKLKDRVHNLNDWTQRKTEDLAVMEYRLKTLEDTRHIFATKEQLQAAFGSLEQLMKSAAQQVATEIARLHDDIEPLKKALYWSVATVVGAVVLAGLALILKGPAHL